jgi:hypothetical protein
MAESTEFHGEPGSEGMDAMIKAAIQVKAEVERLVDEFDLKVLTKRVEDFGRRKPIEFALSALAIGVVAGILMRAPMKNITRH